MILLHYIIKPLSLCIYVHITPFSKHERDSNLAYVNQLLPVKSKTWEKEK